MGLKPSAWWVWILVIPGRLTANQLLKPSGSDKWGAFLSWQFPGELDGTLMSIKDTILGVLAFS